MPLSSRRDRRRVAAVLRGQDVAHADRIADVLRSEGWLHANRSLVIRSALVFLSDAVEGKSPEEILRYFTDRVARRATQKVSAQGTTAVSGGARNVSRARVD